MMRIRDILFSSCALLLLLPLLIGIVVLIRWRLGGPIFFRQQRPGLGGEPFYLIKFRTMTDARDESGDVLADERRMTMLGRCLRATSLDELPELWNVLKGDMSLVGPRPLLMEYLPLYTAEQARRHEVRPGLTGWAQVNGRNSLSWEDKFALDVWYVDNQSMSLDWRIIFRTLSRIFRRDGISAVGEATMPRFTGSAGSKGL